jgi:anthranilate synthase/phosphoribosyltransferase
MYLILDNYDSFTYNIYQYLIELTDKEVRVVRNDKTTIEEIRTLAPEGIIISPGPGRPEDAGISVELVRSFAGEIPILGVCLGHQAIGYAFGANIVGAGKIMHGKTDSILTDGRGLFRTVPTPAVFTRYHSLVVEEASMPDTLEVTSHGSDGEVMGIRHREYIVEGIQFHPESIASEAGKEVLKNFLKYRLEPVPHRVYLEQIIGGTDLSLNEAADVMRELTEGTLSEAHIAAYLMGLNCKGIAAEEIAGCASVLQEKRTVVSFDRPLLDTCGTGGDGLGTFNISSLSAIAAAACGVLVAKHGNRAISSLSGSADFYRELGIDIQLSPGAAKRLLEETGFTFLFAPIYHGAMRYAAPVRRSLGVKTIMNLLGPLVNPAGASFQLIGVYDRDLAKRIAQAAKLLGIKRVLVVHGDDGLDEISVTGNTSAIYASEDDFEDMVIDPLTIVGETFELEELSGGSGLENAKAAREIVAGGGIRAIREAVQLNAGAGLWLYGAVDDIKTGYERVRDAFADGSVESKLDEIVARSNELSGS